MLKGNGIPFKYEKTKLKFTQPEQLRSYTVDFDVGDFHIETKGRLTSADRKKMLLVTEQHPDKTIVMVFSYAQKKLYKGSPTTYADWCDKNNIFWLDIKQVKENPKCILGIAEKKMEHLSGLGTATPKKKSGRIKSRRNT